MDRQQGFQDIPIGMKDLTPDKMLKCECGNTHFAETFIIFKIPGLQVGSSKDVPIPIRIYKCDKCGKILEELNPFKIKE